MDLIRCFIAVEIPQDLKSKIDEYISGLKKIAPEIKWVKAKNLHITLKFLGEIKPDLVDRVKTELDQISGVVKPFEISIADSGFFPNSHKPRVVWLGLQTDKNNSLFKLHQWIEDQLTPLGFKKENRRFSPHLTIGRIKIPGAQRSLNDYIKSNKFISELIRVEKIVFVRSILKPTGAEYSKINDYSIL